MLWNIVSVKIYSHMISEFLTHNSVQWLKLNRGIRESIRRLLAAVGLPVTRLVRLRVGPIRLGSLAAGDVRPLTHDEVIDLARAIGR